MTRDVANHEMITVFHESCDGKCRSFGLHGSCGIMLDRVWVELLR